MGNTGGFVFEVFVKSGEIIYGEAFNAAPSFCKSKMRQAIHKFHKHNIKKAIVLVNSDVNDILKDYTNKKEKENSDLEVIKVYCKIEA